MEINKKSLLKKTKNNFDIIYLALSLVISIVTLFISYELALALASLLSVLGVFLNSRTLGIKYFKMYTDERANYIIDKACSLAFCIIIQIVVIINIILIFTNSTIKIQILTGTQVIMILGYLSETIIISILKRIN